MIRCSIRDLASSGAVAIISAALLLPDLDLSGVSSVTAWAADTPSASDACGLLTPADIAKATGLKIRNVSILGKEGTRDTCHYASQNRGEPPLGAVCFGQRLCVVTTSS